MLDYYIAIVSLIIGVASFAYYAINSYMALNYKEKPENPEKVSSKDVTIVVPVYNEDPKVFNKCIKAIKEQKAKFLVIADEIEEPYRSVTASNGGKFIFCKERGGKRQALSTAIGYVNTKYVLFVDSDTIIPKHTLKSMLSKFDENVGAVGTAISIKLEDNWVSYCSEFLQRAAEIVFKAMSTTGSLFVISGRCCMYRTAAIKDFLQSDEFLENRVLGKRGLIAEDTHMTHHILKLGYKTVVDYNVNVVTEAQQNFRLMFKQVVRWARGGYLYFIRDALDGSYLQKGALYSFETFYIFLIPVALITAGLLRLSRILSYGSLSILSGGLSGLSRVLFINASSLGSLASVPAITIVLGVVGTSIFLITMSRTISKKKLKTIALGGITSIIVLVASIYALLTVWEQGDWLTR